MKRIACFVAALASTGAFASTPDLTFPAPRLQVPALSLAESAKTPPAKMAGDLTVPLLRSNRPAAGFNRRFLSQMPIVKPSELIDPGFVVRPDESVDYKLLILRPSVQSRR